MKVLLTNNGLEFKNSEFYHLCTEHWILSLFREEDPSIEWHCIVHELHHCKESKVFTIQCRLVKGVSAKSSPRELYLIIRSPNSSLRRWLKIFGLENLLIIPYRNYLDIHVLSTFFLIRDQNMIRSPRSVLSWGIASNEVKVCFLEGCDI